jgi:uncharacterized damage-inducible protein DinB
MKLEMIQQLVEYHTAMTRNVWESIGKITDEQFVADDSYSRGSIRNLMVHLASTDRRWLAGLKNLPEVGHLKFEDFPTIAKGRKAFDSSAQDLAKYVDTLSEAELDQKANGMADPRWVVLMHMINHGTDHRATVLQRLHEFGAPTFNQDYILWLWNKE